MVITIQVIFILYYLLVIVLWVGWRRAVGYVPSSASVVQGTPLFISVIVPFRNERMHILSLLNTLILQTYPREYMEVILVDDHSEDRTSEIVKQWIDSNQATGFNLINLQRAVSGKKSAITEAIGIAKGDIIVTTDADCTVQPGWLASIARSFEEPVQMVSGPVRLVPDHTFFGALQALDFASLIGTGAATLALGIPTMCNGANLAFRKITFEAVGGYQDNLHIASGDDEFLLKKVLARNPGSVKFNRFQEAVVSATALSSFRDFFHQRVRWASKWRKHRIGLQTLLAIYIFVFHCAVLAVVPLVLLNRTTVAEATLLLGGKMILEYLFLIGVCRHLKIPFSAISFLILQIVYPLYAVVFGVSANVFNAHWKGRKI